jgi:hypothetical protein
MVTRMVPAEHILYEFYSPIEQARNSWGCGPMMLTGARQNFPEPDRSGDNMGGHDFTFTRYRSLCCHLLDLGFKPVTLSYHLSHPDTQSIRRLILRHDVDFSTRRVLRMAGMEHDLSIQASYYLRYPRTFDAGTFRSLVDMGHEVGYHYDVLTRSRGDMEQALRTFGQELAAFRTVGPVTTVSAHGASRASHDNRTIWQHAQLADYHLLGEAYLSIPDFCYLSDSGRTWSPRGKVRDAVPGGRMPRVPIETTDDLIGWIAAGDEIHLCLNVHPERWPREGVEQVVAYCEDLLNNFVKWAFRRVRTLKQRPTGISREKP